MLSCQSASFGCTKITLDFYLNFQLENSQSFKFNMNGQMIILSFISNTPNYTTCSILCLQKTEQKLITGERK